VVLGEGRGTCLVHWRLALSSGRLTVSGVVSEGALPDETKSDSNAWACCIGGALEQQEYPKEVKKAGSKSVQVLSSEEFYLEGEGSQALTKLLSIAVKAYKGT